LLGRIFEKSKTKLRAGDVTKITGIVLVTLIVAYIQTPAFALTRGPAPILVQTSDGQQGNVQLFPQIQNYTMEFLYRDTQFEELSGQDYSLAYRYSPISQTDFTVWVTLEIAETTQPLHPWEVCLITWPQTHGYQTAVTQQDLRDVTLLENPPVVARYFAFQYKTSNQTQLVLYWFERTLFNINNATVQKNVKISLVVYLDTPEDLHMIEEQLLPFATAIVGYWEPLNVWNTIMLTLSHNSLLLATATIVIMVALVVSHLTQTRRHYKVNATVYDKLSKANRQIIDAVQETEKKVTSTLDNIASTYQKTTDQVIGRDQLMQKLSELEKIGILKSHIINKQDEPILIWKTQT
jgi:hypothetical protein